MIIALVMVTLLANAFGGYIENVEITGCQSCRLMLTCRKLDSIIAILDVNYKAEKPIFDTGLVDGKTTFPPDHPRDALNKRCSGLNHCSFILTEDSPGSEAWGKGNITVHYACVTQDRIQRYCNSRVELSDKINSGVLHNPGYPRFYSGQKTCTWKLSAPVEQKLKLRMLDVALFDTRVASMEECKDVLEIIDTGQVIYSTCAQEHPPDEILSGSSSVEVVLRSRLPINARRGVLIYFSLTGCPPLLPPKRGYLVSQNESMATLACCHGYVFPDTQTRMRTIRCSAASWNVSLPLLDCEDPDSTTSIVLVPRVSKKIETMASDLIAPILVIVLLFAVNGFVIYYIHKLRKKQIIEIPDEELGTFTSTK